MEISTTPVRWADFQNKTRTDAERDERASRTNVTRLDYLDSGKVVPNQYTTPQALSAALKGEIQEEGADECKLRLFVVEDLSREVIVLLGAHCRLCLVQHSRPLGRPSESPYGCQAESMASDSFCDSTILQDGDVFQERLQGGRVF